MRKGWGDFLFCLVGLLTACSSGNSSISSLPLDDDVVLDRSEVTVRAYRDCVKAGACLPASVWSNGMETQSEEHGAYCNYNSDDRTEFPVNCISQGMAERYCEWRGKRLPTWDEWRRIACGDRAYPWGQDPLGQHQICWRDVETEPVNACPVDAHPESATPDGLHGISGNLQEWTASPYCPDGVCKGAYVVAGGTPVSLEKDQQKCGAWGYARENMKGLGIGFRCAAGSSGPANPITEPRYE